MIAMLLACALARLLISLVWYSPNHISTVPTTSLAAQEEVLAAMAGQPQLACSYGWAATA
jgi:hypothetical protein